MPIIDEMRKEAQAYAKIEEEEAIDKEVGSCM
jgi:hypothetical protein